MTVPLVKMKLQIMLHIFEILGRGWYVVTGGCQEVKIIIMLQKDHLFPAFRIIQGLIQRIQYVRDV